MREYRLFYVKMPNGFMLIEIFSINKPLLELRDKLCDFLGVGEFLQYHASTCLVYSLWRERESGLHLSADCNFYLKVTIKSYNSPLEVL